MTQSGDKILHRLFRKGEASYAVSDVSKAIAPLVDLLFVSLFIGASGVTVMCYVSPMFMLFALVGLCISNGARNKVSVLLGEGNIDKANSVFSASIIMGAGLSVISAVAVGVFCSEVSFILGAREPEIFEMTKLYIWGYLIGYPFLTMIRVLTPFLQMEGQYRFLATNSVITTALDIALDALVIFALHGGMFGIALATSLGYIIPFFMLVASFIRRKNTSVFRLSMKGITLK
ncbi:MAG: polysaccharide biosynthesis C-terminal domain-containing protein, partial [Synergistaceae bacterium]|nr:polysaccharide biosynthesis C-terminal domain-containing protein [Synergistaceae bacterium]